ncbi:TIGR03857 family LLM class F420-dependent oxidoreductase [Streptomyces sp. TRM 70351]|uniref:TIGR03857 family LLM class F420-dependent oxidoreductase n=1 Tax=Streptomyces sp. TRM 70351 TaxID=3116552 RepID=UPI002E7C4B78|nr:TIGR03857 family LLM class F420-dependent oxidoreductase [Streptomyces sp. TRM 70351]MEE1931285.1 TIGR03857 family LLM class F420-dependent oxidoreductase [Streptomyces sp. TRM 70351]
MTPEMRTPPAPTGKPLAPAVEDMSAWIIAGAVGSDPGRFRRATEGRTPAQGIQDGVDAERLGFRRVWLSERWNIKLADVILAGVAARTTRLGIGTGAVVPTTRHPWATAALGATMHAAFGERFVLGLGRGEKDALAGMGIKVTSYEALRDYIHIYRRLWAGETVRHDGPAGRFDRLHFAQTYEGKPPEIWLAGMAKRMGAELIAAACDGVLLPPMYTPGATRKAVARIRAACERIGRDPATVRVCVPVVTAPDMDEVETLSISAGRLTTYLQFRYYGDMLAAENGWDPGPVERLRCHEQFKGLERSADHTFQRHEMLGPAARLPQEWITDCSAIGSVDECVASLQRFLDAGADEVATFGSTPMQNAALIAAWRDRDRT